MLEFFAFLVKTIAVGYVVSVVVALKTWVVDNENTTPKAFYINVALFIVVALVAKYFIW